MVIGGVSSASDRDNGDHGGDNAGRHGVRVLRIQAGSPWNDEKVAQLLRLHEEGCSASVIGGLLGFTRNSVIGRLHRMGMQRKTPEIRLSNPGNTKRRQKPSGLGNVIRFRPRGGVIEERAASVVPLFLALADLETKHCRFPYGEGPYTFCGHKQMDSSSYCPDHFQLTWMPKRARA